MKLIENKENQQREMKNIKYYKESMTKLLLIWIDQKKDGGRKQIYIEKFEL